MCCVIKPLCGWNVENVSSVSRERCGGQGYLAANRFGIFIGLSHAAMTAEGDNSVLMQKVAKERLSSFKPNKVEKLKPDVNDPKYLHGVLANSENVLFMTLGKKLMSAGKENLFSTWMLQESDLVQAAAHAYGERLVSESFASVIESADDSCKTALSQLYHLHLLSVIENNLGPLILSGVLPAEVAQNISARAADLCRDLTPQALSLTDAFAMNNEMLSAPIARDWVKYNVGDNQGELACDY